MPLYSDHITNMYYSGAPSYTGSSYGYNSSVSPLGLSYSASYLTPGGSYSGHSSLGGYSRAPISSRWVSSVGRNYSPILSSIAERRSGSPVRISSPRRIPISKRTYTGSNYTPRPVNINTADIDVSRDKYRRKIESPKSSYKEKLRESPCTEKENSPFMPRVDGKPETGIDSSPGLQRATIKRGRTVVRLHTLKRKERDSPRKPVDVSPTNDKKDINDMVTINKVDEKNNLNESGEFNKEPSKEEEEIVNIATDENVMKPMIISNDTDNKSSENIVDKCSKKDNSQSLPVSPILTSDPTISKLPDRRLSMELLAEQASLFDSLIRNENLSTATIDISKVGVLGKLENTQSLSTSASNNINFQANPLKTTKSDQSLHNSLKNLKDNKDPKHFSKRRSLKKSFSGGSICRLDSITEFPKDLNHTELPNIEERLPVKEDNATALPQPKPKLITKITSSVEISTPKIPLKFKIENVVVEEKLRVPKKEIIYSSKVDESSTKIIENNKSKEKSTLERSNNRCSIKRKTKKITKEDNDPASPEPEDGNFWNKIGKRETVYLIKRKQELNDAKEKTRRALCWFPEDEELDKNCIVESREASELLKNHITDIDDVSINTKDNLAIDTKENTLKHELEDKISEDCRSIINLKKEIYIKPETNEQLLTKSDEIIDIKTLNDPIIAKTFEIVTEKEAVSSVHEESKINSIHLDSEKNLNNHETITECKSNAMESKEKTPIINKDTDEKCDNRESDKESKVDKLPKQSPSTEQSISTLETSEDVKTVKNIPEETKKEIHIITDKPKSLSTKNVVIADQKIVLKTVQKSSHKLKDQAVNKIQEQPKLNKIILKTDTSSLKQSKPSDVTTKTQKNNIALINNIPLTSKTNEASDVIQVKPIETGANDSVLSIQEGVCSNNIELNNNKSKDNKSNDPSEKPKVIESENIPTIQIDNKHEVAQNIEKMTGEDKKAEDIKEPSPKKVITLPPVTNTKKPIVQLPQKVLIATPRPLQKRAPQTIRSSTSESSSEEESSDEEDETEESSTSEESAEFFECENNQDGRISTGSNDSGFDSSAPTSPAAFLQIKKDCDVNCHRKCEKLTANLCGVNQRLLVEALASRTASKRGADTPGTSSGAPAQNVPDILEQELEQSTAYGIFRKTGRFTPPATSIPRFRKYNVEDFHFVKVLGKGSFGKVLLAELRDTEYYYAVKCLKKDVVLEDDDVECTLIERKVLALGTNHPYLCHLFATFQTDSHLFFVMEYLNGGDLMFHIQQSGRFPEARARFYAAEIVSGLKFLHKRGIVYRDLKLDNILLDFDGHVRIADFGMCKLQIYLDKTADTFCGTPDYMAPEIIKGLKYNQTVDWWSFGVLLYEMLIGQSPFSGCDEDELFWSICNEMPSYPRFLSQEALTILTRFLDKDARTRLGGSECMHGDIREQDFFHPIHWDRLERRDLDAPFRPRVRHPLDTQYFDRAFTGERPRLTAVEPHVLRSMDQEPFRGFSYTNPNATDR